MLLFSTQNMDTATQKAVLANLASANVALRTNINTLTDFSIKLRENTAERKYHAMITIGHHQMIKTVTQIAAAFTRNQTEELRVTGKQSVFIDKQGQHSKTQKKRQDYDCTQHRKY